MHYQRYWVGLDAGHLETAMCLINEEGRILFEGVRETRSGPIRDVLRQFGVESAEQITIEAGVGTQMVRELRDAGFPIRVVDVRKSSKFLAIRRQKTDFNDARGLAELGLFGRSIDADVFLKPVDLQAIRNRLTIRRCLLRHRVTIDALTQAIFRQHGGNIRLLNSEGSLAIEVEREVQRLSETSIQVDPELSVLVAIGETLRTHIAALDKSLRVQANEIPACANFQTIPGVGPIIALSFYSTIADPYRFQKSRDVGAYLGLTPRLKQSGVTARSGRITRFGNKMTRAHLTTAATVLLHNIRAGSTLRNWGLALAERIGLRKARVALARKLAVLMLDMWKSGQPFDPMRQ